VGGKRELKLYFHVLGCPKNEADVAIAKGLAVSRGHTVVESLQDLGDDGIVVVYTCGFVEAAKRESIEEILTLAQEYRVIGVGCLVHRYCDELKRELREVDGLIGMVTPGHLVELLERGIMFYKPLDPETIYVDTTRCPVTRVYEYVKIADGCSRKCSFCAIPFFKGAFRSRPMEVIVEEVRKLLDFGVKEIILVSQDSTAFGVDLYGEPRLPELLGRLSRLSGDFWIRVMYLHPDHINDEIIDAIALSDKVVPYFDLPVQHGSDKVLKLMGRKRGRRELEKLVESIRSRDREAVIRSTVMVGHPGEGEKEFLELLEFLDNCKFDRLGVFRYSEEEGTVSATLNEKVDENVASDRLEEVMKRQALISSVRNKALLGKQFRVLVESRYNGVYIGRTYRDAPEVDGVVMVKANGKMEIGRFINARIVQCDDHDLEAVVVE